MKLSTITENVVSLFTLRKAIHLLSQPGQGKSSETENVWPEIITKATGKKTITITVHGTTVEGPDVRGFAIPVKSHDAEGNVVGVITKYASSPILEIIKRRMAEANAEQVIVFLDEFAQADHIVQKAMAPLILDGRLGDDYLPEGAWVVMASNRTQDGSGANKSLRHIVNRVATFDLDPDMPGLLKFWGDNDLHPMGAAFIEKMPGLVFGSDTNDDDAKKKRKADGEPFLTPRSLTAAFEYLGQVCQRDAQGRMVMTLPTDTFSQEVVTGFIGQGGSAQLFGFLKVANELPTIGEIEADPSTAKLPKPERPDASLAASAMLVHHAKVDGADGVGFGEGNVAQLWAYAERLPMEFQVACARQLVKRSGGLLLNDPAMTTWMTQHKSLIMASI